MSIGSNAGTHRKVRMAKPPLISSRRRRVPSNGIRDPERTRRNLLDAAYREFATSGYHGASIERICRRAGVSKQILIHHFGSKANAHLAVLEAAYRASRAQDSRLQADDADPVEALRSFVGHAFDHLRANRDFVSLLGDENVNKGRHIRKSTTLQDIYAPLIASLDAILRRGEQTGMFRPGMDALQLYVSISALCFFTFSNTYTLSAVFGRDLMKPEALAERRRHVIDFVLAALCRATGQV
jgi:TetR/AcrR family transcriptional regulator